MADNPFHHDAAAFDPIEAPTGVDVNEAEAKYAALFAEVIWDGVITAEKRDRLKTAATTFGLDDARVMQIEQALTAAHTTIHHVGIVEEAARKAPVSDAEEPAPQTMAPLAQASDPRLAALQGRIDVLEGEKVQLEEEKEELSTRTGQLEQLVGQLQHALESTMDDLDKLGGRLGELETGASDSDPDEEDEGPVSTVQPLGSPEEAPAVVAVAVPRPDAKVSDAAANLGGGPVRSRRTFRVSELPPAPAELQQEIRLRPSRGDPAEIHRLVRREPRDPQLLRALFDALQRADDLDRRWCISHVLVFLGEANDEERELYVTHGQSGLVRPRRAINEDEWRELLFHPDESLLTGQIMAEIAPAVLLGHATAIRASLSPDEFDPAQRVDPSKSTLQAVRCVSWASAILGLQPPTLYAAPDYEGLARVVLDPKPASKIGREGLMGRSTRELAFFAGSHLTWYRKEHILAQTLRSMRYLEDCFLAALMIGNPGLPMTSEIKKRVEPIRKTIAPLLDESAVQRLQGYFARFVEQGGRTNLAEWVTAVKRTAASTGLLLANDLYAARDMLAIESPEGIEEQVDELIVFFTAGRCSLLRKRIGLAIQVAEGGRDE